MPRIMITCPSTGESVPTGHRTPEVKLDNPTASRAFRCPVCAQVHRWEEGEARIEDTITLAAFRASAA